MMGVAGSGCGFNLVCVQYSVVFAYRQDKDIVLVKLMSSPIIVE